MGIQSTVLSAPSIFPFLKPSFADHLRGKDGSKFIVTNVKVEGRNTTVWINTSQNGSWRSIECSQIQRPLDLSQFAVTPASACLSYDDINSLARHFYSFGELMTKLIGAGRRIGGVGAQSPEMRVVLQAIHDSHEVIVAINNALAISLDTPIYRMRRTKRPVVLFQGDGPTEGGGKLLQAFSDSIATYDDLPRLTAFGTDNERAKNVVRSADNLRVYMEEKPGNPLGGKSQLDFVHYELKPLNIASRLKWNCSGNPRTDSIDLLLKDEDGCPVVAEVKMAGDSLVSVALTQLLYYAAVLCSKNQRQRLSACYQGSGVKECRRIKLAIIAEKRDGFPFWNDLESTRNFLKSKEAEKVLGEYFSGCYVLVIEQNGDGSYRMLENQEWCVNWGSGQS